MSVEQVKKNLIQDPTYDYVPHKNNYYGELFVQQLPPWRLLTGRLMLSSDPIVNFALNIRNAALMTGEVIIKAKSEKTIKFIQEQWDFLWNNHRSKLVNAKQMGFYPLQMLFKEDEQGKLIIKDVKEFLPEDCKALVRGSQLTGLSVKGKRIFFPRACWLTFNGLSGDFYGNGCLRRAYPAWYEKWMNHGSKRLLQLRMIKDAYIGDIFWYPPDLLVQKPDGTQVSYRDLLREIGEKRLSGSAMTLPRLMDNQGNLLTDYTPPQDLGTGSQIFEWVDHCDQNILMGADISIEVIKAPTSGSGFSGRSIPFLVTLSVCTQEFTDIVRAVDEQVLRPLCWLNEGREPDYQIIPRSLVESFSDDISGSPLGGSSIGSPASARPFMANSISTNQQVVPQQQFSEEELKYPLADREKDGWYSHSDYEKTGTKLIWMHPTNYLKKVRPLDIDEVSRDNIDYLKQHIKDGGKLDPLSIYANGKEDGRHRSHAAKELGIKKVPVLIHKNKQSQHSEEEVYHPTDNLKVRIRDLRIAENNLKERKESVTPDAPVEISFDKETGKYELEDGYHRYLKLRGGSIVKALENSEKGIYPKIKARIVPKEKDDFQFSEEKPKHKNLTDAAIHHFGITDDMNEAGYILPSGHMLDFSGRHYHPDYKRDAQTNKNVLKNPSKKDYQRGRRDVDHRELHGETESLVSQGGTDGLMEFMHKTGAIRLQPQSDSLGIHIVKPVEKEHLQKVVQHARRNRIPLYVDVTVGNNEQSKSFGNPTVDKVHEHITKTLNKTSQHSEGSNQFIHGKQTTFQGYRGETKGGGGLQAHGVGTYYGLEHSVAQRFSKPNTVKSHTLELKNPAVVHNDDELTKLKKEAEYATGEDLGKKGNLYTGYLLPGQDRVFTRYLVSKGHDGIIINHKEAAGGRQAVVFDRTPSQHKEGATYNYSCCYLSLPEEHKGAILALGNLIPKDVLYGTEYGNDSKYGLENDPHITILYGLHTNDSDEVESILSSFSPIAVETSDLSVFENEEYDVLKLEVKGSKLYELNNALKQLEHTNDYPCYKPHITVAYITKGEGQSLCNKLRGYKSTFMCDTVIFSPAEGEKESIYLSGDFQFSEEENKENHQLTREEYHTKTNYPKKVFTPGLGFTNEYHQWKKNNKDHEEIVHEEFLKGKRIPKHVRKDYPHLFPEVNKKAPWQISPKKFNREYVVHGTQQRKKDKPISYVEPRIGRTIQTLYGESKKQIKKMGGKELSFYREPHEIEKIKHYATGTSAVPARGKPKVLVSQRPGDLEKITEEHIYHGSNPFGTEPGDLVSESGSHVNYSIPLKHYEKSNSKNLHEYFVKQALRQKLRIPKHVQKHYPELFSGKEENKPTQHSEEDSKKSIHNLYHGTRGDFEDKDIKPNYRVGEQHGYGIHFTPDKDFAELYSKGVSARKGKNPRLIKASLENVNLLDAEQIVTEGHPHFELAKKLAGKKLFTQKNEEGKNQAYLGHAINITHPKRAEKILREHGYDGVTYLAKSIVPGVGNSYTPKEKAVSHVVFDSSKVKIHDENSQHSEGYRNHLLDPKNRQLPFRVHQNPTREQTSNLLKQSTHGELKFLRHPDGNHYVWDSYHAHHMQVSDLLGFNWSEVKNKGQQGHLFDHAKQGRINDMEWKAVTGQTQHSESETNYTGSQWTLKRPIRTLKNPSPEDLEQYTKNKKSVRGLHNLETGDSHYWDANEAVHSEMIQGTLGLEGTMHHRSFISPSNLNSHLKELDSLTSHLKVSQHSESIQFAEDTPLTKTLMTLIPPEVQEVINDSLKKIRGLDHNKQPIELYEEVEKEIKSIFNKVAEESTVLSNAASTIAISETLEDAANLIPESKLPSIPNSPSENTEVEEGLSDNVMFPELEDAIQVIKASPLAQGVNYIDTANKVKEGCFAITAQVSETALEDIRNIFIETLDEGLPQKQFIEKVAEHLELNTLAPNHVETIFRTNVIAAYSDSQERAMNNHMVQSWLPYVAYYATRDGRVRPEHWAMEELGLDGTNIYNFNDPTFRKFRPPWGYNCRCRWVGLSIEDAANMGVKEAQQWYARAKTMAEEKGGTIYEYFGATKPQQFQYVTPPNFNPPPEFVRNSK